MPEIKCPLCGSRKFYVKDPDDAYETYPFECRDGEIIRDPEADDDGRPEIDAETEAFCDTCTWHGAFGKLEAP